MTEFQPAKKPRRFIAGTRCPECNQEDTTVMYENESGDETRECVRCGFTQSMNEQLQADAAKAAELATRVTPEGKVVWDEGEKPIKIIGLE